MKHFANQSALAPTASLSVSSLEDRSHWRVRLPFVNLQHPPIPNTSPGPFHPCWGCNNRLGSPACVAHRGSPCSQGESLCNSRRLFIFNENTGALFGESSGCRTHLGEHFRAGMQEKASATFHFSVVTNTEPPPKKSLVVCQQVRELSRKA